MVQQNKFFPEIKGNFGLGCMRLPMAGENVDLVEMEKMVDAFMQAGFNYFDTAHGYLGTKSEPAIREAVVKRYPRESFVLTNKLSTHFFRKEEEIRPLFEQQLEACGVDYFDFYLMHAQDGAIYKKFKQTRAYEAAMELKAEGKIRHFGISFHDKADVLDMPLLDTTTSRGLMAIFITDLVLQILSFVAETEREHIKTRQCEGIAAAKARGVKFGRPAIALPPCFKEVVQRYRTREITLRTAANICGMSRMTFWRKCRSLL